jgi:hypothetical protein
MNTKLNESLGFTHKVKLWVRVNQRIRFPPNDNDFPLSALRFPPPNYTFRVELAGGGRGAESGKQKAESRKRKTFGGKCIR